MREGASEGESRGRNQGGGGAGTIPFQSGDYCFIQLNSSGNSDQSQNQWWLSAIRRKTSIKKVFAIILILDYVLLVW